MLCQSGFKVNNNAIHVEVEPFPRSPRPDFLNSLPAQLIEDFIILPDICERDHHISVAVNVSEQSLFFIGSHAVAVLVFIVSAVRVDLPFHFRHTVFESPYDGGKMCAAASCPVFSGKSADGFPVNVLVSDIKEGFACVHELHCAFVLLVNQIDWFPPSEDAVREQCHVFSNAAELPLLRFPQSALFDDGVKMLP